MDFIEKYRVKEEMDELVEDIEKMFRRYNVYLEIDKGFIGENRFIFILRLKRGTRIQQVNAHIQDVRLRLKLPFFVLYRHDFDVCFVVSRQEIKYDHLPKLLNTPDCIKASNKMQLPYVVGYNVLGGLVIDDLCTFPHLLVAGSSNSGKTVSLKALIASIAYSKSPYSVNCVLIDVGANDLMPFDDLPHLSCPVIQDTNKGYQVLLLLKKEMERRIGLQVSAVSQYENLPQILLIIDEFPALFADVEDKKGIRLVAEAVSSLLRRGRHAKIHVVLAAQNPTLQNMHVDLGNVTARMAFKCAKRNFSEVILGESGAENLLGQGDMYFKSPQNNELQRIQGAYVSSSEIQQIVTTIKKKWGHKIAGNKFKIMQADFQQEESDYMESLTRVCWKEKAEVNNKLVSEVALWALEQNSISCNTIMEKFSVGWHRANSMVRFLNGLGIVGDLDAKLPRKVLPQYVEEIPQKALDFFESNGIFIDDISNALTGKRG